MYVQKRELRVALPHVPIEMDIDSSDKTGSCRYQLSNISRTGMFLETEEDIDLRAGASIHFNLKVPHEVRGVAKVRWVRPETIGPYQKKGVGLKVLEFHENAERTYLKFLEDSLENLKVTDLMQTKFTATTESMSVRSCLQSMTQNKADVVIITNNSNNPVGLFQQSDVIAVALGEYDLDQSLEQLGLEQPQTVTSASRTEDVYSIMRYGTVDHLPVTESGALVGMISIRDLVPFWSEYMDLQARRMQRNYEKVVSVVAHDLRTPIAVIKTANHMTESEKMTMEEYCETGIPEIINSSCETMLKLIDGILDATEISNGNLNLKRESVDLEDLIDRVARCHGFYAASKKIDLEVDIPLAVPKVRADSMRIEQVLNNLVGNAIKFCKKGQKIVIGLKAHHSQVALWIADNGPGIPRKEQESLFEEYVKTSVQPSAGEKGSGLGLAICKRIIDAHEGSIRVDSRIGEGTTFTIFLPIEELN